MPSSFRTRCRRSSWRHYTRLRSYNADRFGSPDGHPSSRSPCPCWGWCRNRTLLNRNTLTNSTWCGCYCVCGGNDINLSDSGSWKYHSRRSVKGVCSLSYRRRSHVWASLYQRKPSGCRSIRGPTRVILLLAAASWRVLGSKPSNDFLVMLGRVRR